MSLPVQVQTLVSLHAEGISSKRPKNGEVEVPILPMDKDDRKLEPNALFVDVKIDDDDAEFKSLTNSETAGEVLILPVTDFEKNVKCFGYNEINLKMGYPGVFASAFHQHNNASIGFLRINPRTTKPFKRAAANIVYIVMEGEIIVKEAKYEEIGDSKVLSKIRLEKGKCLTIPEGHPYALENRQTYDAVLQYVVTL